MSKKNKNKPKNKINTKTKNKRKTIKNMRFWIKDQDKEQSRDLEKETEQ